MIDNSFARSPSLHRLSKAQRRYIPTSRERNFATLALLLFTGGVAALYAPGEGSDASGFMVVVFSAGCAYLYAIATLIRFPVAFSRGLYAAGPLAVAVSFCLASTLWSIDDLVTLRRAGLLIASTAFGVALAVRFNREQLATMICIAVIIPMLVGLLVAVALPSIGIHQDRLYPAFKGLSQQRNGIARSALCAIIASLALISMRRRRYLALGTLTTCVIGAIASLSATALLGMATVFMTWVALAIGRKNVVIFLTLLTLIFSGIISLYTMTDDLNTSVFFEALGRDDTMSGRTSIYSIVLPAIESHPWLGYGYEAFFTSPRGGLYLDWGMRGYIPPHAHNGFLQAWLGQGLFGMLALIIGLAVVLSRGLYNLLRGDKSYTLDVLLVTYAVIGDITSVSLLDYNNLIWAFFVAVAIARRETGFPGIQDNQLPARPTHRPENMEATDEG